MSVARIWIITAGPTSDPVLASFTAKRLAEESLWRVYTALTPACQHIAHKIAGIKSTSVVYNPRLNENNGLETVWNEVNRIGEKTQGLAAALVLDTQTARSIVARIIGLPIEKVEALTLNPASLTLTLKDEKMWMVEFINDDTHLQNISM